MKGQFNKLHTKRGLWMKVLNYHISYDHIEDLYTVTAETDNGKTFYYTFSDMYTLKDVRETLERIASEIDK